jgi:hypothetical protein
MSFRPFSQSITEQKRYSFPNLFSFLHVSMIGMYNGQYEFITTESTQNVTSFVLHLKNSIHHEKQKILQNCFVSPKVHLDIQLNNQKKRMEKFRVSLCQ